MKNMSIIPIKAPGIRRNCCFVIGLALLLAAQSGAVNLSLPMHFDLGPAGSKCFPDAIIVTDETEYQTKSGYGLLGKPEKAFILTDYGLKNEMTIDGVMDAGVIQFRMDVEPGEYWLELFMDGGEMSFWLGEIRVNGELIADTLFQYGVSFEEEDPPAYWTLMRKVWVKEKSLVLSVMAAGQKTTLTGLSVYANDIGPLKLNNGLLEVTAPLKAPNAVLAAVLINKGVPFEAQRIIDQIPEREFAYEKALLLLALAGRLEVEDPRSYVDHAETLLRMEYENSRRSEVALNLRLASLYIEGDTHYKMGGWDWARFYTGGGIFDRINTAGHMMNKIMRLSDHPLSHRATFYLGRIAFWAWVEQHDDWQKIQAERCFKMVRPFYPDFRLLRMYMGDQIRAEDQVTVTDTRIPEWVLETHRALISLRDVIHYWVDFRQADNGEFGGKYDDDVEMLRWWPITRLALNDSKTLLGMRRLVDGVWTSGWITNGFSTKVRDVEHSSEPVADTQPMMIGLDYGNPIYVERCMESVKGLRDVWTGINSYGHRHFKSSWYSYDEIDSRPPRDCDVEMNTRTVKAARWLAWYNRHPYAMQFLTEWADAWLEDCRRTDKGKPYGIVPSAIRYEDDAIGGHADNWHHPEMFWGYYNFHGGISMLRQFLAVYQMTGEQKYLEPVEEALKLVEEYASQDLSSAETGSKGWVVNILRRSSAFAETIELWRLMTGNSKFDHIVAELGSDYLKFRLTGDAQYLLEGSRSVADGILYNRELITTEGYFTDRIEIGNINRSQVLGSNHLESMYTGSALYETFHPFYAITWNGFTDEFVAVVKDNNTLSATLITYNMSEQPKAGAVTFWNLEPGEYELQQGPDENGDGIMEKPISRNTFMVSGRSATCALELPSRSQQRIRVRQVKPAPDHFPKGLADLAITEQELEIKLVKPGLRKIGVPVHNIGIAPAHDVTVRLFDHDENILAEQKINTLDAPLDLEPRIGSISFEVTGDNMKGQNLSIVVDAENRIAEINEGNNRVVFHLD